MISEKISYPKLLEAVRIAFSEDKEIYSLYDPLVKVSSLDEIVSNIDRKLREYKMLEYRGVYHQNKLIGYYAFLPSNDLVSFSINISYRKRTFLKEFFRLIRNEMDAHFKCVLWSVNKRAIKWLMKMNMKIDYTNQLTTRLIFKPN